MCGRYRLSQAERFAEINDVRLGGEWPARFNVAPTQRMPVVLDEAPGELTALRWGLVPSWAKDTKIGAKFINARCETVASTPAFRAAYKRRRCLVPADGFYEWQKAGAGKISQHILMRDGTPFAFAGLWDIWRDPAAPDAEPLRTFTIITGPPNELVAPIHDRMPVILRRENYAAWLSAETSAEERAGLLGPFPAELIRAYPISARVNSPRNDDAAIIDPVVPAVLPTPPPSPCWAWNRVQRRRRWPVYSRRAPLSPTSRSRFGGAKHSPLAIRRTSPTVRGGVGVSVSCGCGCP